MLHLCLSTVGGVHGRALRSSRAWAPGHQGRPTEAPTRWRASYFRSCRCWFRRGPPPKHLVVGTREAQLLQLRPAPREGLHWKRMRDSRPPVNARHMYESTCNNSKQISQRRPRIRVSTDTSRLNPNPTQTLNSELPLEGARRRPDASLGGPPGGTLGGFRHPNRDAFEGLERETVRRRF